MDLLAIPQSRPVNQGCGRFYLSVPPAVFSGRCASRIVPVLDEPDVAGGKRAKRSKLALIRLRQSPEQ